MSLYNLKISIKNRYFDIKFQNCLVGIMSIYEIHESNCDTQTLRPRVYLRFLFTFFALNKKNYL